MKTMDLVAVFVENKPGQTARITKILSEAAVNIAWTTIENSGSFGVMKFLVDKVVAAQDALRAAGIMVSVLNVLAVEADNRPGALQAVAELLGSHNINVANCSGFISNQRAILIVEVQELERAADVLEKSGMKLLSQEEMLKL